jgi:hypothetical protein
MRATGSKLIKVGHLYGKDIFWDVDRTNYIVVINNIVHESKDIEDLFTLIETSRSSSNASKINISNS